MQRNEEIWKDIPSYLHFQASSFGRVRRLPYTYVNASGLSINKPLRILAQTINKKGYYRCDICGSGSKKSFTVHRLVMYAFVGQPPAGMDQINHIDGDKQNNVPDNLEWSNNSHNIKHAWAMGLHKPNLPKSLQSPHAVILVHSDYGSFYTIIEAAAECGISRTAFSRMIHNKIPNTTKYLKA